MTKTPPTTLIIGVGCDEGQYYFETLPDGDNGLVYTTFQNVTPAKAGNTWGNQYRLNNIKSLRHEDDRNWKAAFCRPISDVPSQATIDAMEERNEQAAAAQRGVL
jgi:hypothetical protein